MPSLTKASVKFPKRLLSLDTGRKMGWAISEEREIREYGLIELYKSGGDHTEGDVLTKFYSHLADMRDRYRFNAIAFEQISGGAQGDQIKWSNMYRATIILFADIRSLPVVGIAPATIKKAVTGSGRADKTQMLAAIKDLGYSPKDDNVADAIGCAMAFWDNLERGLYNDSVNRNNGSERGGKKPRKRASKKSV